ncbi:MAG: ABC transporter permease [Phycisphaerales bacterium]|nr:ABC transporter permease [Phycisphaerales bacterium]
MSGSRALFALTAREWRRFARQPSRVVATLGTAAALWGFLAGGFAGALGDGESPGYALFLLPGVAMMAVTFGAIFGAISLIQDRQAGFLQSALASPAPLWSVVGAKLLAVATIAGAQAFLILLAAPALGARPGPLGLALGALGTLSASVGVGGVSLALAWRIDSTEGFHGVMNLLLMPMWLLSGAFFPADSAHPVLRAAMAVNPLRWTTDAVRAAIEHGRFDAHAWIGAAAFAALGAGAALAVKPRPATTHGARA